MSISCYVQNLCCLSMRFFENRKSQVATNWWLLQKEIGGSCRSNWWLLQKKIGGSCRSQLVAPAEGNWWLLQKPIGGSCRRGLVAPAEANWWLLQKGIGGSCRSQLVAPAEGDWWLLQKETANSCRRLRVICAFDSKQSTFHEDRHWPVFKERKDSEERTARKDFRTGRKVQRGKDC